MKMRWGVGMLLGGLMLLAGCKETVPSGVIQPRAMEDLLYDYHLAGALGNGLNYRENYKKEAYLNYVFSKHGVTRAEFDSSMVWYTRHTKELSAVYKSLQQRMEKDERLLKAQAVRRESEISVSVSGDTVDVWQDRTLCWLTAAPLTNRLRFDLKADTSFHPTDRMELMAYFHFIPQDRRQQAVMGLRIQFDNDSVAGITRTVTASGPQRMMLRPDSAYRWKNVSGFVYYPSADSALSGSLLLHDIRLMRYHVADKASSADSLRRP